jgi:dolichol-phosphate mannosyltransferase
MGIGEVIERIPEDIIATRGYQLRVVVVDGHSTDSTCEIAISMGAEVIEQKSGVGKGNGVREALAKIFQDGVSDEDLIVMMDADATYFPEDLPRFVDGLKRFEVVWGSRLRGKIERGSMSATNKLGNRLLSLAASIVFLKRTTDLCTGYWGFRGDAIRNLTLTADGFNLEADLFGSIVKRKLRTKEIAINYANREGSSSLKWYKDGPRILFMTIKRRLI